MVEQSLLKNCASYVNDKINANKISNDEYVTTDNVLQNKQGITKSVFPPAEDSKVTHFKKGDVLVANIRPYLKKIWFADFDGGASADVLVIRAKQGTDKGFLYYSLFRDDFFVHTMKGAKGTKMPRGDKDQIMRFHVPKVDLPDQQKIASVLSTLDEKIALNNQINAKLEQMAKTLYDYWFVQFDFPDDNGKPYKSSGGEMVYNETLKRDIPKGWEVETLDKHISIKRGISYKSHEIQETGTPFLNLNSFYLNGSFKVEGTKFFNGTTKSENLLKTGDLVVAVTDVTRNADIIGKSFIVPNIYEESFLMSCDVAMIKSEKLPNSYLEKLFNSYNYHEYIKHYASGTLVLHLDTKGIGWFETFIPSSNVLKKYDDLVQQIIARKIESIKQNAELTKLRDWLLPMLMNGQITVQ